MSIAGEFWEDKYDALLSEVEELRTENIELENDVFCLRVNNVMLREALIGMVRCTHDDGACDCIINARAALEDTK